MLLQYFQFQLYLCLRTRIDEIIVDSVTKYCFECSWPFGCVGETCKCEWPRLIHQAPKGLESIECGLVNSLFLVF